MNGELAGVAAGVGTDLAFKGPLVVVDPEVLLQAAAVCRGVQAVFAFVRLLARVRATVHVQLVPPTEALVAQLTFKRLLAWMADVRNENRYLILITRTQGGGLELPVWVFRCRSMSFWPYCVLKVQPAD